MTQPYEGKSVLVVDDDPEIRQAIVTAFSEHGAEVSTAEDGDRALDMIAETNPDLVVLDAMMPKRSGFLVLERVKGGRKGAKPHIIMITGNQGQRHKTWAETLGVDEYINKPFRMERLLEKATKLLAD